MLFLIGISVTFFLEILLLSKKNKSNPDKILVSWLLFIGIHLLLFYLRYSQKAFNYPFIVGVDLPMPLLHGPLLYLYVSSLTNQLPKRKYMLGLHFIPIITSYIFMIPFFLLSPMERIEVFKNNGQGFELFSLLNFLAIIISGISYFIWSLILLRKHSKNIKNLFSDTEKINLQWLRYLTYGLGSVYLVSFFFNEMYLFTVLVVYVNFIGIFGIKQVGIFTNNNPEFDHNTTETPTGTGDKQKYAKSGLSDNKAETTYLYLMQLMSEKELFTISELTLVDLAKKLNIHPNYLSQIINEKTSSNFYAFINNLRIEKFLTLINDPQYKNLKLIELAYDCGFNSKSSFNKYFKNKVGKTPTEYINDLKKSEKTIFAS